MGCAGSSQNKGQGYFLNPRFMYNVDAHVDGEVLQETLKVIGRLSRTPDERLQGEVEMNNYRIRTGTYFDLQLLYAVGRVSPENVKKVKKPKPWKHTQPLTRTQLRQMRDEFWDTQPHYGGQKEIWDALRAAAEASDLTLAQAIVDSAGIIVSSADLTTCYDERGAKYELPKYVLSEPTNLIRDG